MLKLVVGFALLSCALGDLLPSVGGIYGGADAAIEKFPYQASLHIDDIHFCSGSLYGNDVVITTAACVQNQRVARLSVRAGSSDRNTDGILFNVTSYTIHPLFNSALKANDIALLHLDKPFPISKKIKPVKLASKALVDGTAAFLSGWELENSFSSFSTDTLQYLVVNVIERSKCEKYYYGKKIQQSMFCAVSPNNDSCQGEEGSPMVIRGVLHGILSWGSDCIDQKEHSAVYTDVASFKSWIEENA